MRNAWETVKKKYLTIPNLLSLFRLLLSVIVWLYAFRKESIPTTCVLVLSGITDIVDGFIAQ